MTEHILKNCLSSARGILRRSFKKLALAYHPDRGGDEEFMKELVEARDELMEAVERDVEEYFGSRKAR